MGAPLLDAGLWLPSSKYVNLSERQYSSTQYNRPDEANLGRICWNLTLNVPAKKMECHGELWQPEL